VGHRSEPYTMTIEIMNVVRKNGAVNSGHPGVMCNVIDENKFDAVYFQLFFFAKNSCKIPLKTYLKIKNEIYFSTGAPLFIKMNLRYEPTFMPIRKLFCKYSAFGCAVRNIL